VGVSRLPYLETSATTTLARREGCPVGEVRLGDVVWFAPGEKQGHRAMPATAMTHMAIQERADGKVVDWMEHVTDEQYRR